MAKRVNARRKPRLDVQTVESDNPKVAKAVDFVARRRDILDKSRSFGVVTGNFMVEGKRVAYEVGQGTGKPSKLYDNDMQRIYREGEEAAEEARRAPQRAASTPKDEEPAQIPNPAPRPDYADPDDDDDDEREEAPPPLVGVAPRGEDRSVQFVDDDDKEVNLTAWALGQAKYRFALVRQAIAERYHREITNEPDALDFLIGEGLVRGEEVQAARGAAAGG